MTPTAEDEARRVRLAALLLIAGLVSGPLATHVYWLLGGTWGLYQRCARRSGDDGSARCGRPGGRATGRRGDGRSARVGLWHQAFVSDRMIRFFAWALAAAFLLETLAAFTWSRSEELWWMYGPVSLVIAVLALVVAGSEGAWRIHPRGV